MKTKSPAGLPALEKGQLWQTKTAQVEIMDMGKLLAQYRFSAEGQKRGRTTTERVRLIQDYLNANGAKLVKNVGLKAVGAKARA